jgi:hypothetical protein
MQRPQLSKSIGTKLSEAQHDAFVARARAQGLSASELNRQIILSYLSGTDTSQQIRVLLAELLSQGTVNRNILFLIANGESVTAEQMQELIARADSNKALRAREMLSPAVSQAMPTAKLITKTEVEGERCA